MTTRGLNRMADEWEAKWDGAGFQTKADPEFEALCRRWRENAPAGCLLCLLDEME